MAGQYFAKERERFETRRVAEEIPLFFRMLIWLTVKRQIESGDFSKLISALSPL